MTKVVLVFSSDERGSHSTGAGALALREFAAVAGQSEGLQGHSYGIPTRDSSQHPLPLPLVTRSIERFITFAQQHPETQFEISALENDLPDELRRAVSALLRQAPKNCLIARQAGPGHNRLAIRQTA